MPSSDSAGAALDRAALRARVGEFAAGELAGLALVERLRAELSPEAARHVAGLVEAARRAALKLAPGQAWLGTSKAVEQATHRDVAAARARHVAGVAGGAPVLDLTCGLGGDAAELARAGLRVVALERNVELAALAALNLGPHGVPVLCADAARPPLSDVAGAFLIADPDRRAAGRRELDPNRWSPPASALLELASRARGACLKFGPALEPQRVPVPAGLDHAWQWVARGSRRGELAELALWTGELARGIGAGEAAGRRGLLRVHGDAVERLAGPPAAGAHERDLEPLAPEAAAAVGWIAEGHPALLRSGLLPLAAGSHWRPLGPRLGFLGPAAPAADAAPPVGPWLALFRVLESAPLDRRAVRAMLRRHDVGPLEVRRRGHPEAPESLAAKFRVPGAQRGLLLVARLAKGHRAYLVEEAPAPGLSRT